jgi:Gpi18-like mannosyltransferase
MISSSKIKLNSRFTNFLFFGIYFEPANCLYSIIIIIKTLDLIYKIEHERYKKIEEMGKNKIKIERIF